MQYNILDYLEKSFSEVPDKFVFIDEFNKITYSELYHYARAIGTTIHTGISGKINQPVVVYVDRNLESLVCFQGVAYSGNFYVPIDIQMPKLRIELILKTLNPIAQIVKKSDLDFANSVAPELRTFIYEDSIKEEENSELLEKVRRKLIDRDPVYATFTSGSTGVPKGVVTCHQSVIDMTDNLVNTFNFSRNHIYGNQNPFYFDASIKDIYCTLSTGGTMHIIPRSAFMFPGKLVEYINLHKIDTILWSAAAIALMANSSAFDPIPPSSLKKVMFSGEVMHNKVLNYWRRSLPETMFVNLYGPTEITSVCTYYIVNRPFADEEVLPVGIPFKNTEILLLNEENQLAKEGETGEICVRGCCLALGYYNNAEKTTAAFCQNPLNSNFPETIYRTGDLARYNEDGQIMFMSRKDNQVKHMGQRVELGEIEILINSMERIDASICFYDHDKQKIVTIYKGTDSMVDKKYILNELKDRLPKFMFPNILIGLNELPYNLNGKIDRTLLKGQYESGVLNLLK